MADLEIIDFHTHTQVNADRGLAWQREINARRKEKSELNGTLEECLPLMEQAGISHTVMLMFTPTHAMYAARIRGQQMPDDPAEREKIEREVKAIMVQRMIDNNAWASEVCKKDSRFSFFAGLDPVYMTEDELVGELDDKIKRGARGGKVVLSTLGIEGDDPRLWPIYERLDELELPFVPQGSGNFRSAFEKVMSAFPRLPMVMAHLAGAANEDDFVEFCHRYPNFHGDLSSRLHEIDDPNELMTLESLAALIRKCGPERILFGTNYPLNDPLLYARVMRELPLKDAEKELVANGNAKRLLKM